MIYCLTIHFKYIVIRQIRLTGATVEGLKRLGVAEKIFQRGIPQDFSYGAESMTGVTQLDARHFYSSPGVSRAEMMKLGHKLPYSIATASLSSKWSEQMPQRIMQSLQEEILLEKASEMPNVQILYGWEIINFFDAEKVTNGSHGVLVKIKNVENNNIIYIHAKFLVGCDGPGSFVSSKLQAKFDGFVNLGQTRSIHFQAPELYKALKSFINDAHQVS